MLFILFGGTLETGWRSREILKSKGFHVITKYNLVEEGSPISASQYRNPEGVYKDWFNDKIYVTPEEYRKCDFKYELNGVSVGFNQQQIMDAIHGVTDCILTIGAGAVEFIGQLKKAYGDYVTLINLFIDDSCYEKLIAAQPGITRTEYTARMAAGRKMQQIYLENYALFDEVVIYTGENTPFDDAGLERQFEQIVRQRKKLEISLNNQKYVRLPYIGSEPYIFVSYSHRNKDRIYPVLGSLQRHGFRIWYDEGITGGANWRLMLKDRIRNASCFLLFSSAEAVRSTDVIIEITTAGIFNVPVVCVSLDDSCFDATIEEELRRDQLLSMEEDFSSFEGKLIEALPEKCRI